EPGDRERDARQHGAPTWSWHAASLRGEVRGDARPPGPLVRLAHAPALREGEGRSDERQVREGLREVPELPLRDRVVLLGQQADVVAQVEQPLEQLPRLLLGALK